jgi:phospholipid/cholesterol/gamma-HCH transport system substrate-binding protein
MKSKEIAQNVKLGAFVLTGLVLFFLGVFLVGSQNNLFNKTFSINAIFKNVEGLKEANNVWLSGVKIGTVKEVKIVKEGKVVVTLSLKDRQNKFIKKNATAVIGSDGLVGSKIVVIKPGDLAEVIQVDDTIGATSPADTQELINIAKDVGENTRSLTDNLDELTKKVAAGQGIVGELLNDGKLAQDLRSAANNMQATTFQTAKASEQLNAMMYKLNNGDGLVNKLASDTTLSFVFDQTLQNVREVSRNSAEMSKGIQSLISKMNSQNNAIGVLLADSAFAGKLKETLDNAESASAKLDENMEAMQHNFLLRGYFKKKDKREAADNKEAAGNK